VKTKSNGPELTLMGLQLFMNFDGSYRQRFHTDKSVALEILFNLINVPSHPVLQARFMPVEWKTVVFRSNQIKTRK
jgi:hypothetical protein